MTDIIFSFDTEDFTSNTAADAIYREAEILREEGVRGGFCIVGLLASQLIKWGRSDVLEALRHHDILSHSYGHTLHPTINEYTDLEDFDEAYGLLMQQETQALEMIREFTGGAPILGACPPGNQKSYVAMYGYADLGLPLYSDTFCDTPTGKGTFYCNIYQTRYTFSMEEFLKESGEEYMRQVLDELAQNERAICYTHPNMALYREFWDVVNYRKENKYPFEEWKEAARRPVEESERYYDSIRRFVRMIKADGRFRITSYSELVGKLAAEPVRVITRQEIPAIRAQLEQEWAPIDSPSYSIADVFLACRELLLGAERHTCGKVYGFLEAPYGITEEVKLTAAEVVRAAKEMNAERFLPAVIRIGEKQIGPADWLRAALAVLCGEENVTLKPGTQLPCLDHMPELRDAAFRGKWMQSDAMEDRWLSERLRLQAWTMRHPEHK